MKRRLHLAPWSGAATSLGLLVAAMAAAAITWRVYLGPAVVLHLLGLSGLGC